MKSPLQNAIERKQLDKMDSLPPIKLEGVRVLKIKIEAISRRKE